MDIELIILSEETNIIWYCLYAETLKHDKKNELICKTDILRLWKQIYSYQRIKVREV